jgi:hypothetical protein
MRRRSSLLIYMIIVLSTYGCIKETYDMNKLSNKAHLTLTMAISAIKGDMSFSDMVAANDTVVFDQNKLVKLVFKKDSIIDLRLADFYNFGDMISFSKSYTIGDLTISPFEKTIGYSVGPVSSLADGSPHSIPPFGSTNLGEQSFSFTNFENAVFRSGFLDIVVKNNLPVNLNSSTVNLYNTSGHTTIVTGVSIPAVNAGQTVTTSIDLSNKTVTNSISAGIILSGSPGNLTPIIINANNSNIQVTISGRDLRVKSGRAILPSNTITSLGTAENVTFDPGAGVELTELMITTGNLSYHVVKPSAFSAFMTLSMPTASRNTTPVSEQITLGTGTSVNGNISFNSTFVNLGTDPVQLFNRVPYSISISSSGMVTFNSTDVISLDLELLNPVIDYVKGYFGQQSVAVDPYSLDLKMDDVLKHITGTFRISNPSIKLNYSNSFGIPMEVTLNATGKRNTQTVNLSPAPFKIKYPKTLTVRDADSSFTLNNTNSTLADLISLPPSQINFTGSAKMNPSGLPAGGRNNYVFGNSRIVGKLEVEVPLELRFNNLQFKDTVDNFMKDDGSGNNNFTAENFKLLRVDISANNGFPLGASISMSLYKSPSGSVPGSVLSTVDATGLLEPADVDSNGKVTVSKETSTSIEFTKDFFDSVNKADKIIIQFKLNTTNSDLKDVKIYSDYRIEFNAALVMTPDISLK